MERVYDPKQIERRWAQQWEAKGYTQPLNKGTPYCIMLPPPNVTGTLHMGHGFQQTLMDALIRKHRMQGYKTLWQAGTDHAGIATQMLIERQLAQEGKTRHDLGREKFLKKVWEWREQSGYIITQQIRRLGASIDWTRERFSMDSSISHATREAFIRLYEEELIYRGQRLVNWDPQLNTAISDLEVTSKIEQGQLWYIRYPLTDDSGYVVIATTRPETMLGDTAVAVHPDDERYQTLIGKTITLPLSNRKIPIIADESVDREFGTGCVKITPAHDFSDYEIGQRHELPIINIFTSSAHLNKEMPKRYRGLDRFIARKKIVTDLEAQGLLEKTKTHSYNVPRGDRSGAIIEPMLTDQWYLKTESLAKPAIDVVEKDEIQFVPNHWKKSYLQWLYNIQDWCISRQLWWGHRIPVWYDKNDNIYVGHNEMDIRRKYQLSDSLILRQDPDILDTWFSAALWPFSSLGWPNETEELKIFYPTDVLVTGFDIIFFWVARMVMMGLKFVKQIPFRQVYITGLIRDRQGKKMSKTKGNILDPIDLIDGIKLEDLIKKRIAGLMQPQMAPVIEKATRKEFPNGIPSYGTDALRFTFCALASTGRDINFDFGRVEGYRNFCNKLWNAARYVLMHTENHDIRAKKVEYNLADLWIRSVLQQTIKLVNQHFDNFRFDLLAQTLYEFTWNQYCDWYLELSKCVLNDKNASVKQLCGTRLTLLEVLEMLLRLMHPVMPFITEEIWHRVAPLLDIKGNTIMLQPYPQFNKTEEHNDIQQKIEWMQRVINAIRNVRSEMGVTPAKKIRVVLDKGDDLDRKRLDDCLNYIKTLARVKEIQWQEDRLDIGACATAIVDHLEIHLPLAGLIDQQTEMTRLSKEIAKLKKEKTNAEQKLQNPNYVNKAPPEVVAKEREKLQQVRLNLEKLQTQYERIGRM